MVPFTVLEKVIFPPVELSVVAPVKVTGEAKLMGLAVVEMLPAKLTAPAPF